ncbi:MAG TPA: glycoside hydrolase [Verrucomicrobiae bacterium]|nr:glycoside hydrolase [Verrucomicrobiae bacterium]
MKTTAADDSREAIAMCRALLWRTRASWAKMLLLLPVAAPVAHAAPDARFTRLAAIDRVQIIAHATAFPGGRYEAINLIDGDPKTEYSSAGKGVQTFVDFDFGEPVAIAGMKHIDRNDPATVDESELTFSNEPDFGAILGRQGIDHEALRAGTTLCLFPRPITARYARWRITRVGPKGHGTVGGAAISFFAAGDVEAAPTHDVLGVRALPAVVRSGEGERQPVRVTIRHPYVEPADAKLEIAGGQSIPVRLSFDQQTVELSVPPVDRETPLEVSLRIGDQVVTTSRTGVKPVRHWELVLLPHSHVDIGYTHVQTEVEKKQWDHLEQAIELARQTEGNPPEARFRWNSEVLWAVDSYLQQASPEKREALLEAVRKGWIGLDGLYGNELTALCRPEELFRLVDCAARISRQHGLAIDTAMISDVPGYTWGIVPALAHSGIKYFSIGPNYIHRIGRTLSAWGDRPFYWISPSGQERVLCWIAGHGYSWFHKGRLGKAGDVNDAVFFEYLEQLTAADYPYDLVQLRYSIGGDNGPPDPELPAFVRQWNDRYKWPKMRIALTSELMRDLERRHGDKIPEVRGDFTPYWEDGAGSSARETAIARNASERLVQAEILWSMLDPKHYPDAAFYTTWRNVILYNEHTWGANCSIRQPDSQFTKDQWAIKQAFALEADKQSRRLIEDALTGTRAAGAKIDAMDVFNTCSWPRTDLVILPPEYAVSGDAVLTAEGAPVPSQRLSTGELAFRADDVPPLAAKRFHFSPGKAEAAGSAHADKTTLSNGQVRLSLNPANGAISGFVAEGVASDLVDGKSGRGLNEYFYETGRSPTNILSSGPATITVQDAGPLVASLRVESEAPGCQGLVREMRLIDGLNRVDLINTLDKRDIREKESVHFGFAFAVPDGQIRMDAPWAVVRPEEDQLPGACKNYLTIGRWIDLSNTRFGVTWATVDAPLVEIGDITVDVPTPFDPKVWIEKLRPGGTFYSYVMNNYWETNYKASQEGPTTFRYALQPHGKHDQAAAARFGMERSQPLVVVPVDRGAPVQPSLFTVEPPGVLVTSLKPSLDGKALMVRLFNAAASPEQVAMKWPGPSAPRVMRSSPKEERGSQVEGVFELPSLGIITLRVEPSP